MNDGSVSASQEQTSDTFSFKWGKSESYGSSHMDKEWQRWLFEKYFDSDNSRLAGLFGAGSEPKKILDAGCGAGKSAMLLFGQHLLQHDYFGVDVSDSVNVASEAFRKAGLIGTFAQADLAQVPDQFGNFDIIFSEGVLHHTDSVEDSILALAGRLNPGGTFLFYVYSRKAPVREFTDDFIRSQLSELSDEEAWEALLPLTKFGKNLGDLGIEIEVEEDIPLLGIEKGSYDLQRLVYYSFFKAYFRPEYSLEEMNHINFDWFRPLNCHRHSPEEVASYCLAAGLEVSRLNVEPSGITVIAHKS